MKTRSSKWAQNSGTSRVALGSYRKSRFSCQHWSRSPRRSFVAVECLRRSQRVGVLLAAACIQLRLLANMLDGLIAVEGGRKTATGELYNEIPDRVADVVLLVSAGYASQHGSAGAALGWCAAVLAVGTAYLRALGARRGHATGFQRPTGQTAAHVSTYLSDVCLRPQRALRSLGNALFFVLILLNVGTLWTCIRRTRQLAAQLRGHS